VPFAIGSETWGSIHVPAAYGGITGLRPTYGRVSRHGAMALSWTMDKIGPLARDAWDCAAVLAQFAGPDAGDPTTLAAPPLEPVPVDQAKPRLGLLRTGLDGAPSEIRANFEASVEVLREVADIEEVDLPDLPYDAAAALIVEIEAASAFEEFITSGASNGLAAPEDRLGLYDALAIPAVDYLRALRLRRVASRVLDEWLAPFDAVLTPTRLNVAPPIDQPFRPFFARRGVSSVGGAGNLCGLPSITVPNGFANGGLPTGLEFLGRSWSEHRVVAAAAAFQDRTGWHRRHPELAEDRVTGKSVYS
jgi:aspartyl-tRNA(Asn)/glutamyl-tRNA(Gln) amidotransferase subunit A